jgi:molecular chaperone GrpE
MQTGRTADMERDPHMNGPQTADETGADVGDSSEDTASENSELTSLQEELDAERKKAAEYLDQAQRSQAEFANYRRRKDAEFEEMRKSAGERIIARLLPAFDDLNRAIETLDEAQRQTPWAEGIKLIQKKIWSTLEAEGVKPIESLGKPFDPSVHEAISMQDGTNGTPVVIEEFQRGYMMGDRVIRPAMVVVGSASDLTGHEQNDGEPETNTDDSSS